MYVDLHHDPRFQDPGLRNHLDHHPTLEYNRRVGAAIAGALAL